MRKKLDNLIGLALVGLMVFNALRFGGIFGVFCAMIAGAIIYQLAIDGFDWWCRRRMQNVRQKGAQ